MDLATREDLSPACDPPPSLAQRQYEEPCLVFEPCWSDIDCVSRCNAGDCQNPAPLACIAGRAHRCVEDDVIDPANDYNMGVWEAVGGDCCDLPPEADVAIEQLEVLVQPESRGLLPDAERALCHQLPEGVTPELKVRGTVANLGNEIADVTCTWLWREIADEQARWHPLHFDYDKILIASFDGRDLYPLLPGERVEVTLDQWPIEGRLCPALITLQCYIPGGVGEVRGQESRYNHTSCSRADPQREERGLNELLPIETCPHSPNEWRIWLKFGQEAR